MQGKSPLEEYAESCNDDLLKQIIQVYAQHKYEGKEAVAAYLQTLFAKVLEERINAAEDGNRVG